MLKKVFTESKIVQSFFNLQNKFWELLNLYSTKARGMDMCMDLDNYII